MCKEVQPSQFLNCITRAPKSVPYSPTPPLFHMTNHLILYAAGYTHPQIYPFLSLLQVCPFYSKRKEKKSLLWHTKCFKSVD